VAALLLSAGCREAAKPRKEESMNEQPGAASKWEPSARTEVATFGAGCFWCVEAVLEQLEGVIDVVSGYMGGHVPNPTYEQVSTKKTGHAEVVQVTFDPERISYEELLEYFWKLHDPTTADRQGNDIGPQYRSAIFFHSEEQRLAAERSKKALEERRVYPDPIVTEITAASAFYRAEGYHQDYYRLNKSQPYCRYIILPKLEKLGLEP
jgi:peptide-methionine (S)-S-oxide reductase